ncbi:MAG: endonuclease domain-containing protein, partial [Phycisphaeraceae bacterium]
EQQMGLCAICRTRAATHVDHDHRLARIHPHAEGRYCPKCFRGMTCANCNTALGMMKDRSDWLRAAAVYVDRRQ